MTIAEMHVMFRMYSQQMGLQNVRSILPEQIDSLLNTSISDTLNDIIKHNIDSTNDRVITDNSKIGQINALKGLYCVKELDFKGTATTVVGGSRPAAAYFSFDPSKRNIGLLRIILEQIDYLYYVDFNISYKTAQVGFIDDEHSISYATDGLETNYFPVRLIDDAFLAESLNDFVLKNRVRTPILTIHDDIFDLYIDKMLINDPTTKDYTLVNKLIPYKFRVAYIAKPAKVSFAEDVNGVNIDCNLPDFLHVGIVKHAVDLYHIALSGDLHAAQQQAQSQQQENVRNNASPDNNNNNNN